MIMLDCGLSGKQAAQRMQSVDLDPRRLDAMLISHEHSDHIRGVGVMSRRYRLPVYGTILTHHAAEPMVRQLHRSEYIQEDDSFAIGEIDVTPFPLSHDAADPMGYVFRSNGHRVAVCTDTGIYDSQIMSEIHGSDIVILESNHDERMLREGSYPRMLKERIAGRFGHLSNRDAGKLLLEILTEKTRAVMLAHLSEENNYPAIALKTVQDILLGNGMELPQLHVAQRYEASCPLRTRHSP